MIVPPPSVVVVVVVDDTCPQANGATAANAMLNIVFFMLFLSSWCVIGRNAPISPVVPDFHSLFEDIEVFLICHSGILSVCFFLLCSLFSIDTIIFYPHDKLRLEAISDGVRHIVLPQGVRRKLLLLSPRKPSPANVQKSALLALEGVFVDQRTILPPTHMMGNTEENHPLRENVALFRAENLWNILLRGELTDSLPFFLQGGLSPGITHHISRC